MLASSTLTELEQRAVRDSTVPLHLDEWAFQKLPMLRRTSSRCWGAAANPRAHYNVKPDVGANGSEVAVRRNRFASIDPLRPHWFRAALLLQAEILPLSRQFGNGLQAAGSRNLGGRPTSQITGRARSENIVGMLRYITL